MIIIGTVIKDFSYAYTECLKSRSFEEKQSLLKNKKNN